MEEITINIRGETFVLNKKLLCDHSDYFKAMFSGHYVESEMKEIIIDTLDATTMNILVHYMNTNNLDLSQFSLSTLGDLAVAINFFQMTSLLERIVETLKSQTKFSTVLEVMDIADKASLAKLKKYCEDMASLGFSCMKPEYIPTFEKLTWYLSHPHLSIVAESCVFKFATKWMKLNNRTEANALLPILSCLDMRRMTTYDFDVIKNILKHNRTSLIAQVVDLLHHVLLNTRIIKKRIVFQQKKELCEKFTGRVWRAALDIVWKCTKRLSKRVPPVYLTEPIYSRNALVQRRKRKYDYF